MKRSVCAVLALLLVLCSIPLFVLTSSGMPFTDVCEDDWYYDAVAFTYDKGLFSGTNKEGTIFAPTVKLTRAMFVSTLASLSGYDKELYTESGYSDVENGKWYVAPIMWATEVGVASGIGNGKFAPSDTLTRQQAAAMLYNYAVKVDMLDTTCTDEKLNSFADKEAISSWAIDAMQWIAHAGIINGIGYTTDGHPIFSPKMSASRAQGAQILMNYIKFTESLVEDTSTSDSITEDTTVPDDTSDTDTTAPDDTSDTETTIPDDTTEPDVSDSETTAPDDTTTDDTTDDDDDGAIVLPPDIFEEIGTDRQLFIDDYIVDTELTTTQRLAAAPVKKEAVFTFDQSFERENAVYFSIVDMHNGTYRMYYKATSNRRRIAYIETKDGINWTRPRLNNGIGSNLVTTTSVNPDNLFVFYDTNPNCPENQRLKGIYGQWGDGLFLEYTSTNGDNFNFWPEEAKMMGTPTETKGCYFDSLNTVYYDNAKGKYVAFVRGFHEGDNYNLTKEYVQSHSATVVRDIRYAESDDCINWTIPVPINYNDTNDWQMYTNGVSPYSRAPGVYVGLPTRFYAKTNTTDALLMTSRDLINWNRTQTAFMNSTSEVSSHGNCYPSVGFIQTSPYELSFYMSEKSSASAAPVLYRYTIRTDGFYCEVADNEGDNLVTKEFIFEGSSLELNFAAGLGEMRVIMTASDGTSISTNWFSGDSTNYTPEFTNGTVADFQGKQVKLTFEMKNASLYAFKFN